MENIQTRLLEFYDAVIADDGVAVEKILAANLAAENKFTARMITGMLVIAVEEGLSSAGGAILTYNVSAKDKIADKHLDSIMNLAAEKLMLKPMGITLN